MLSEGKIEDGATLVERLRVRKLAELKAPRQAPMPEWPTPLLYPPFDRQCRARTEELALDRDDLGNLFVLHS